MIDRQDFMEMIEKRHDELNKWLKVNSKTRSLSKLKKMLKLYDEEMKYAKKLDKSLDPIASKKELLFAYSLMNEHSVLSCYDTVSRLYVKQLEKLRELGNDYKCPNHSSK
jgi:hypothetical protein